MAAVAALQRGLSAARREADGSISTTKYMQARQTACADTSSCCGGRCWPQPCALCCV